MSFNPINFIEKTRDGVSHTADEFHEMITAVMDGSMKDYQLSAWLMAAFTKGITDEETAYLTEELANSGKRNQYPESMHIVDKHSTGGVGDKITLIVMPLAASCGCTISKLSGPGLGFTGGTVDKLESIPNMNVHLEQEKFQKQLKEIGCAISGHSDELAPAEGKFYKMRDVTATVGSIPLITASIISKKLAGGASGYVFDVKCGSGAFMKDINTARRLAEKLVVTSHKLGKKASAIISDMEQPLGEWVGNAAEVYEAIEVLKGRGPKETRELSLAVCAEMLVMSGIAETSEEGLKMAHTSMENGSAIAKFAEVIKAQGGDARVTEAPLMYLKKAEKQKLVKADKSGKLASLNALCIGEALRALGGGRLRYEDKIDHSVAIRMAKKIGDEVKIGDTILEICYNDESKLANALNYLTDCFTIRENAEKRKLIIDVIRQ
ncbi:MAG: thymidine phosphorylase [Synergistes sp.]|nr:thymidine phosphorylase [Synergistes sp.]